MGFTFSNARGGARYDVDHQQAAIDRALILSNNPLIAQDPELLALFNQSGDDISDDGAAITDAVLRSRMTGQAEQYRSMSLELRSKAWTSMSEAQRTVLVREHGIEPPGLEESGGVGGLIRSVAGAVNTPLAMVGSAIPEPVRALGMDTIMSVGGTALRSLDVVGDQAAHIFRTTHMLLEDAGIDLNNPAYAAAFIVLTGGAGAAAVAGLGTLAAGGFIAGLGSGLAFGAGAAAATAGIGWAAAGFNPQMAFDAYMEVGVGDRHFTNDSIEVAEELLGRDADLMLLAQELAAGGTVEDVAADQFERGTPEFQQAMKELTEAEREESVVAAIAELNEGKISPGRWLVDAFTHLDKGGTSYSRLSGLADAAFVIVSDPTLAVGRTVRAGRMAKFGLDTRWDDATKMDKLATMFNPWLELADGAKISRAAQKQSDDLHSTWGRIADAFNHENAAAETTKLMREFPAFVGLKAPMQKYQREQGVFKSADDVHKFFQTAIGVKTLLQGKGMVRRGWGEAPTLTKIGAKKARASAWFTETIDFAASPDQRVMAHHVDTFLDSESFWLPDPQVLGIPRNVSTEKLQELLDEGTISLEMFQSQHVTNMQTRYEGSNIAQFIFGKGTDSLENAWVRNLAKAVVAPAAVGSRSAARFTQAFTRQVPFGGQVLALNGNEGTQDLINFVEMAGVLDHTPIAVKNMWISEFMEAPMGLRRRAVTSVIASSMGRAGLGGDQASKEWLDRFVNTVHHRYSTKPIDQMIDSAGDVMMSHPSGILPYSDTSAHIRIPDMKELLGLSRKWSFTHRMHGHINSDLLEAGMNKVWKPSVLLRIGFIPRAGGEELFNTLMRHPKALMTKVTRFAVAEIERDVTGIPTNGLLPTFKKVVQPRRQLSKVKGKIVDRSTGDEVVDATAEIAGDTRHYQNERVWTPEAEIETDGVNLVNALTEQGATPLFGSVKQPMINRLAINITTSVREMLREQGAKGRLGELMTLDAQRATRSVLTMQNPERYHVDNQGFNWVTSKGYHKDGSVIGEEEIFGEFEGDVRRSGSIDWLKADLSTTEAEAFEVFLNSPVNQAQSYIHAAMGSNSVIAEVMGKRGISLGHQAMPGADLVEELGRDLPKIIAMKDGMGVSHEGDPLFALSYYSAVTRWITKDLLGEKAAKLSHRYMNLAVRKELTENNTVGLGDHVSVVKRLIEGLGLQHKSVKSNLQRFIAKPTDIHRDELIESMEDVISKTAEWGYGGVRKGTNFDAGDTSADAIAEWVDEIGGLSGDARGTLNGLLAYDEMPEMFDTMDEMYAEMGVMFRREMNEPHAASIRAQHDRTHRGVLTDENVVEQIPDGETRLYLPAVDRNKVASLSHGNDAQVELILSAMAEKEWDEVTLTNLRILWTRQTKIARGVENKKLKDLRRGPPNSEGRSLEDLVDSSVGEDGLPRSFATKEEALAAANSEHAMEQALIEQELAKEATNAFSGNMVPINGLAFADGDDAARFAKDLSEAMDAADGVAIGTHDHRVAWTNVHNERIGTVDPLQFPNFDARSYARTEGQPHVLKVSPEKYGDVTIFSPNTTKTEIDGVMLEGITAEEALHQWSEVFVQRHQEIFRASDQGKELLPSLSGHNFAFNHDIDNSYNSSWFSPEHIQDAGGGLPAAINAPEYEFEEKKNMLTRGVEWGFNKVITPAIDSISRQPLFTMEYIRAYKATNNARKAMRDPVVMEAMMKHVEKWNTAPDVSKLTREEADHLAMWISQTTGEAALKPHELDMYVAENLADLLKRSAAGEGGHPGLAKNVYPSLAKIANEANKTGLKRLDGVLLDYRRVIGTPSAEEAIGGAAAKAAPVVDSFTAWQRLTLEFDGVLPKNLRELSKDEWSLLNQLHNGDWAISAQMNVLATQRAFNAMIPFIDDHHLRSQFQQWVGSYIPFWFAQEQFIKRWARTFIDSPEAIRRMQLVGGGMIQSGVIYQDSETEQWLFVMPGSAAATEAVSQVAERVFGYEAMIPVAMPLTGKIMNTVPGINDLSRLGVPGVGPTVTVPIAALSNLFPELAQVNTALTGYDGEPQGIMDSLYPPALQRFTDVFFFDPDGSKYTAHTIRVIQYMEATGNSLPDDASPVEIDRYLDRVRNWTRINAMIEAIYGFIAPASPSGGTITGEDGFDLETNLGLDAGDLKDMPRPRFFDLMGAGHSFEEAIEIFLKQSPENVDLTPYMVWEKGKDVGRSLSTSEETYGWMKENEKILVEHTAAAAWLIPHKERGDSYSWKAKNEQVAMELVHDKTLSEFYGDLKFAAAMPVWVRDKKAHDAKIASFAELDDDVRYSETLKENDAWRNQQQAFVKQHPTWADKFSSDEGKNMRRATLRAWSDLGQDSSYIRSDHFNTLNGLFELFQVFRAQVDQLAGRRGNEVTAFRNDLIERFGVAAEFYVRENPDALEFWNTILEPEAF